MKLRSQKKKPLETPAVIEMPANPSAPAEAVEATESEDLLAAAEMSGEHSVELKPEVIDAECERVPAGDEQERPGLDAIYPKDGPDPEESVESHLSTGEIITAVKKFWAEEVTPKWDACGLAIYNWAVERRNKLDKLVGDLRGHLEQQGILTPTHIAELAKPVTKGMFQVAQEETMQFMADMAEHLVEQNKELRKEMKRLRDEMSGLNKRWVANNRIQNRKPAPVDADLLNDFVKLVASGQKAEATQLYMDLTGGTLKGAVEALSTMH